MSIAENTKVDDLTSVTDQSSVDADPAAWEVETDHAPGWIDEIISLRRAYHGAVRARIRKQNGLGALVANIVGYSSFDDEKARAKTWAEADKIIKSVMKNGVESVEPKYQVIAPLILLEAQSTKDSLAYEKELEKQAVKILQPNVSSEFAEWMEHDEQRGFGWPSLFGLIGEAGDLALYANPGKLWKRFGMAPFQTKDGWHAGSTCRLNGLLSAAEWEKAGYNPRRRSVAWNWGGNLVKQNKSIYRERYDEVKPKKLKQLKQLIKEGKIPAKTKNGKPYPVKKHADSHAKLLATKLLVKNAWKCWNNSWIEPAWSLYT